MPREASTKSRQTATHLAAPLLKTLQERALPRLSSAVWDHLVVARPKRKQLHLPHGVRAVPLKLVGRRVVARQNQLFDRAALLLATWPSDAMRELRIPKLIIVTHGMAGFRAGDYVLQCPEGTAIFMPAGVPHCDGSVSHVETLGPEYHSCSLLWFTPMVSGIACRMCHWANETHFTGAKGERVFLHNPRLMQLFTAIAEEAGEVGQLGKHVSPQPGDVFSHLLLAFLQLVVRDVSEGRFLNHGIPVHEEQRTPHEGDAIEAAVAYLNVHFAGEMNLDEVAKRFLVSRAQFTRKFRQHTGQSFLEFVNTRRLEQARRLLLDTDWTSAMVAHYVGFKSSPSFHRLFLHAEGVTPIVYRRSQREKMRKSAVNTASTMSGMDKGVADMIGKKGSPDGKMECNIVREDK